MILRKLWVLLKKKKGQINVQESYLLGEQTSPLFQNKKLWAIIAATLIAFLLIVLFLFFGRGVGQAIEGLAGPLVPAGEDINLVGPNPSPVYLLNPFTIDIYMNTPFPSRLFQFDLVLPLEVNLPGPELLSVVSEGITLEWVQTIDRKITIRGFVEPLKAPLNGVVKVATVTLSPRLFSNMIEIRVENFVALGEPEVPNNYGQSPVLIDNANDFLRFPIIQSPVLEAPIVEAPVPEVVECSILGDGSFVGGTKEDSVCAARLLEVVQSIPNNIGGFTCAMVHRGVPVVSIGGSLAYLDLNILGGVVEHQLWDGLCPAMGVNWVPASLSEAQDCINNPGVNIQTLRADCPASMLAAENVLPVQVVESCPAGVSNFLIDGVYYDCVNGVWKIRYLQPCQESSQCVPGAICDLVTTQCRSDVGGMCGYNGQLCIGGLVCDDKGLCAIAPAPAPVVVVSNICGNGEVESPEQCDDGNIINTDSCTKGCSLARCGDGFIQPGEQCDGGLLCNAQCKKDSDRDGIGDDVDNCPAANSNQADADGDGIGDVCDNCPNIQNPTQADADEDEIGDACEAAAPLSACVLRNYATDAPSANLPDVGVGYAKRHVADAQLNCNEQIYQELLIDYCQVNSGGNYPVVVSDIVRYYADGSVAGTGGVVGGIKEYSCEVAPQYLLGDVTLDQTVDIGDAIQVLQYSVGSREFDNNKLLAGDVNCDDQVNLGDAILILRYSAGLREEFASCN